MIGAMSEEMNEEMDKEMSEEIKVFVSSLRR